MNLNTKLLLLIIVLLIGGFGTTMIFNINTQPKPVVVTDEPETVEQETEENLVIPEMEKGKVGLF